MGKEKVFRKDVRFDGKTRRLSDTLYGHSIYTPKVQIMRTGNIPGYFKVEGDGCAWYFCHDDDRPGTYILYDIEIPEWDTTLDLFFDDKILPAFQSLIPGWKAMSIDLRGNGRVYPGILEIWIGDYAEDFYIRNSQFPALVSVRTNSRHYGRYIAPGSCTLTKHIKEGGDDKYILINVFGPASEKETTYCYFNRINEIADYAFEGRECFPFEGYLDGYYILHEHSFDGCKFMRFGDDGILSYDGLIMDVKDNVKTAHIGTTRYAFVNEWLIETGKIERVIIDSTFLSRHEGGYSPLEYAAGLVEDGRKKNTNVRFTLRITGSLSGFSSDQLSQLTQTRFNDVEVAFDGYIMGDDGVIYTKDVSAAVYAPLSSGFITIPEGVQKICRGAFCDTAVEKVYLPSTLKSIEESAFERTQALRYVNIPEGTESIGANAFMFSSLPDITIPRGAVDLSPSLASSGTRIHMCPGGHVITDMLACCSIGDDGSPEIGTLINEETGQKYAFFMTRAYMTRDGQAYMTRDGDAEYKDLLCEAWEANDMEAFQDLMANNYMFIRKSGMSFKIRLAILSVIFGYANDNSKAYAKAHAGQYLENCILEEKNEKEALIVIRSGLVSKASLKRILPLCINNGFVEASAAISEMTKPKETARKKITL